MRQPRTLHIEGSRLKEGQADPDAIKFNKLAGQFLVIEEKVDGTGVSIEFDSNLDIKINHRGSPAVGKQFQSLYDWCNTSYNFDLLASILDSRYILFAEWMKNKHTIFYDKLPSYLLESDIYDKIDNIWLSTTARRNLIGNTDIHSVINLAALKPSKIEHITCLIGKSFYQSDNWQDRLQNQVKNLKLNWDTVKSETDFHSLMEGLYVKHEDNNQVLNRYKYVRYEFLQSILNSGTHLVDRVPISNIISSTTESF